jgi:hypothetical protein
MFSFKPEAESLGNSDYRKGFPGGAPSSQYLQQFGGQGYDLF